MACFAAILLISIIDPDVNFFPPPKVEISIVSGEYLGSDVVEFEQALLSSGEEIKLPYDLRLQSSNDNEFWFKFYFDQPEHSAESLSVYIPTVKQNIALYLNGQWVAQGGDFEPYLARLWSHPQLITLPSSIVQKSNALVVRLVSNRPQVGYLSPIYIGDTKALSRAWRWRNTIKVSWLEVTSTLLIVIGLINLYLWTLRSRDSYYLWYALAAFCWGIRGYLLVWPVIPISDELRVLLRMLTLGYGIVFVVLFNHRYFGLKLPWFDRLMWLYCIPAALPMFFMNMDQLLFYGHQIWVKGNLLLGLFIAIHLLIIFFRQRNLDAIYLLYSGLPLLILGFRDMLVLNDHWSPENGFLMNHATPLALIVAMWFIVRRLANSLRYAEHLNVNLERRVEDGKEEIRLSYRKQDELRKAQLLSGERERIMRDMHDGIGGHLIGMKSLLDSNGPKLKDINRYVDRALVDLRLVINSLDTSSQNISSLLGALRSRWQRLAESKGSRLVWQVSRRGLNRALGPDKTLQLMRVLEEVFTNVIKHGVPGEIVVASGRDTLSNTMWIEITNPVSGETLIKQGRGLSNIAQRVQKMGGRLEISSERNIYSVRIDLPEPQ